MIIVAICAIGAVVLVTAALTSFIRSLVRQHGRERDLLINQMCSLAGTPWQPAPSKSEPVMVPVVTEDFVFSPEHDPEN